jgi:hypothetical protein
MPRSPTATHPAPGGPVPPSRGDWVALPACLVAGAVLRAWLAARNAGLMMDSPLYVSMAEQFGKRLAALGPAHHAYPALIALVGLLVTGRELPGRIVSFVAGLAVILLVYALARRPLSTAGATVAAALVALHPLLAVFSGPIMTESAFLALLCGGLLLVSGRRPWEGGLVLGASYWVRPEALLVAAGAAALSARRWRAAGLLVAGFLLVALPEVLMLSAERGAWTLTPKEALVRPAYRDAADMEWHAADSTRAAKPPAVTLVRRLRTAAPSMASHYLPNLARHATRLLQTWPAPLMLLSIAGMVLLPGPLLAPLLVLLVLPLLAIVPNLRFPQVFVPSLAVYASVGAARLAARGSARALRLLLAGLCLAGGLAWCWSGPAGDSARHFDDGPMRQLRRAGDWLADHGKPGALVMDRKPYVPFYAGMRHALMPDDDYEHLVRYAIATGVDYLVVEEYVMWGMRRQFLPLMTDPAFRAGEQRLELVYGYDEGPMTGVAIFQVLR